MESRMENNKTSIQNSFVLQQKQVNDTKEEENTPKEGVVVQGLKPFVQSNGQRPMTGLAGVHKTIPSLFTLPNNGVYTIMGGVELI